MGLKGSKPIKSSGQKLTDVMYDICQEQNWEGMIIWGSTNNLDVKFLLLMKKLINEKHMLDVEKVNTLENNLLEFLDSIDANHCYNIENETCMMKYKRDVLEKMMRLYKEYCVSSQLDSPVT